MSFPLLNKELNFELESPRVGTARDFARLHLLPQAAERDAREEFPLQPLEALGKLGFLGMCLRPENGGLGCSRLDFAAIMRELSYGCTSTAITVGVNNMVALALEKMSTLPGAAPLIAPYFDRLRRRELLLLGFAITEPAAGSDARAIQTVYDTTTDGWKLRGQKCFISTGGYADAFIGTARSASHPDKISLFLLPAKTPGLRVGKREAKMGLRASNTVELFLDDVRLSRAHLMGSEGDGFKLAMVALAGGRISVASQALGIALRTAHLVQAWAEKHRPDQVCRWKIADFCTEIEAGMLLIHHAASLLDQGLDAAEAAARAKLFCTESANKIVASTLTIMGKEAYCGAGDLERLFRDCRVTTIYEGTSEIQRLVIARGLLKKGLGAELL